MAAAPAKANFGCLPGAAALCAGVPTLILYHGRMGMRGMCVGFVGVRVSVSVYERPRRATACMYLCTNGERVDRVHASTFQNRIQPPQIGRKKRLKMNKVAQVSRRLEWISLLAGHAREHTAERQCSEVDFPLRGQCGGVSYKIAAELYAQRTYAHNHTSRISAPKTQPLLEAAFKTPQGREKVFASRESNSKESVYRP